MLTFVATWAYLVTLPFSLAVIVRDLFVFWRTTNKQSHWADSLPLEGIRAVGFAIIAAVVTALTGSWVVYLVVGGIWGLTLIWQIEFIDSRVRNENFDAPTSLDELIISVVLGIVGALLGPLAAPVIYYLRRR